MLSKPRYWTEGLFKSNLLYLKELLLFLLYTNGQVNMKKNLVSFAVMYLGVHPWSTCTTFSNTNDRGKNHKKPLETTIYHF